MSSDQVVILIPATGLQFIVFRIDCFYVMIFLKFMSVYKYVRMAIPEILGKSWSPPLARGAIRRASPATFRDSQPVDGGP
jgi:hypothetical protein